jgi:Zn-dependent protease/CBS domain-containing protein
MRSIRIGSAFGIPIKLDATFLLVLPLFAYLIGTRVEAIVELLNGLNGGLDPTALSAGALPWVLGLAAALGLFVGIVLHELGHSLVAMRFGFPIDSITLWIFGGIAKLTEMPEDWKQELQIAIAGPIVSVGVGAVCYAIFVLVPDSLGAVRFVAGYLAVVNVFLAVFNMVPAFPMDGGRILRALLARSQPYAKATKTAAEVGKFFAIVLGLIGILTFNIILIGIAFFIFIGAASEAQQTIMRAAFEGVSVSDIMTPSSSLETVDEDLSVADLLDRMLRDRHTGYPVERDGEVVGIVTLSDAKGVDDIERDAYTVDDIMTAELQTVAGDSDVLDALNQLQANDIGRLLVTDSTGAVVGLLSRTDIMTAFNIIQHRGARERTLPPGEPSLND